MIAAQIKLLLFVHLVFAATVNKAGDTPISLAYKGGHWEVVKYLAITHHCDTKSKSHMQSLMGSVQSTYCIRSGAW